jgi:hypothetical protein
MSKEEPAGKPAKKKVQRIKLRIHENPVKFDASITAVAPDGTWMDVEFDGPIPDQRLYRFGGGQLFCDMSLEERESPERKQAFINNQPVRQWQLWEVV